MQYTENMFFILTNARSWCIMEYRNRCFKVDKKGSKYNNGRTRKSVEWHKQRGKKPQKSQTERSLQQPCLGD